MSLAGFFTLRELLRDTAFVRNLILSGIVAVTAAYSAGVVLTSNKLKASEIGPVKVADKPIFSLHNIKPVSELAIHLSPNSSTEFAGYIADVKEFCRIYKSSASLGKYIILIRMMNERATAARAQLDERTCGLIDDMSAHSFSIYAASDGPIPGIQSNLRFFVLTQISDTKNVAEITSGYLRRGFLKVINYFFDTKGRNSNDGPVGKDQSG
jgi:hypothetical protein